jgi:AsmA protein
VKVGLPPAGWISIPVAVTGTSTKPEIKFFSRTGQGILTAIYNRKINKVIRGEKRDQKKSGAEQRKEKRDQEDKAKKAEKQVEKNV